ncbi:MAG: ATP phosphoribosyltransferase regulatory subunit [Clostridia bacterium]|nr:ATP phosphoribosyltransferase regulatory subunit [Clostridia bacterium]
MKISDTMLKTEELAVFRLRDLYGRYGYAQYKMSKFEEYDLYVRNKNFLISDSVITFTDTSGKLMALKPDVTLSIAKNSKDTADGGLQKVYYDENVYRVSAGSHAYKEIKQVGLECMGDIDGYCIGEVLSLAVQSLEKISPDYILDVSHLDLLSLVLDRIGISPAGRVKLVDCVAQKNLHDASAICAGEGISAERTELLRALMQCCGRPADAQKRLKKLFSDEVWQSTVARFFGILSRLPSKNIRVDFSVVSDMNYYNGIVFQGFVMGIPEAILSGGQYDLLMKKMEKKSGAIGFAVYLDQLEALGSAPNEYDVDVFLLYGDGIDPSAVQKTVEGIVKSGKSVRAGKTVPEKLTWRCLLKQSESGVEALENNA